MRETNMDRRWVSFASNTAQQYCQSMATPFDGRRPKLYWKRPSFYSDTKTFETSAHNLRLVCFFIYKQKYHHIASLGTEGPNGEKQAFKNYLNTLVPLHYHELWASIVRDYHSPEATFEERQITIDNVEVSCKQNLDTEQEAAVIAGKTRIIFSKFCFSFQIFTFICFIYRWFVHACK